MKFKREPEEKKSAIISTALNFFFNKGFENTSVNMIIDKLKISKGAFYHHFKSKFQLLDSVTETVAKKELELLNPIFTDANLNALEKFNRIISIDKRWEKRSSLIIFNFMKSVYNEKNITMRRKIFRKNIEFMAPKVNKLIQEGISSNIFKIEYNSTLGEIIINLDYTINEEISYYLFELKNSEENLNKLISKLHIYEDIFSGLLKPTIGKIVIFSQENIKKLYNKAR